MGGLNSDGLPINIQIRDGRVVTVAADQQSSLAVGHEIDLQQRWIILPGFAEPHAHLDKAYTAGVIDARPGDLGLAVSQFEYAGQMGWLDYDDCVNRASRALANALQMGCTALRTHVDCGEETSFDHVGAVLEACEAFRSRMEIQVVALAYQPLVGPGSGLNRAALQSAIEAGVDVVGAAPQFSEDRPRTIDFVLDVAEESRLAVDLHLDETTDPLVLDLEYLCHAVIDRGLSPVVTASHCVSLGVQPVEVQRRIARLVREAEINIVTLPQTNLLLQSRNQLVAQPRGLTAISALLEAGATVAAGSDNTEDPFNPLGRLDPLETASLLVTAGHLDVPTAGTLVTAAARTAMGIGPVSLEPGSPADLVLLPGTDLRNALARGGTSRVTIKNGTVVGLLNAPDLT